MLDTGTSLWAKQTSILTTYYKRSSTDFESIVIFRR